MIIKQQPNSFIFKIAIFTWNLASCVANATDYYVGAYVGDESNLGTTTMKSHRQDKYDDGRCIIFKELFRMAKINWLG